MLLSDRLKGSNLDIHHDLCCREGELVELAERRPEPYNITTSLQQLHTLRQQHLTETIKLTGTEIANKSGENAVLFFKFIF